jgi:serine protease
MHRTFLVVITLVLSTTACEIRTPQGIGGACEDSGDCAGSAQCATNFPGGYCFTDCASRASACPSSSMCVRVSGSPGECYQRCSRSLDCRTGYTCASVSNSASGVCLPR